MFSGLPCTCFRPSTKIFSGKPDIGGLLLNDTRGFFAKRSVLRLTAECLEKLHEGVPPAMIEKT
ncbi:hypothetical protein AB0N43_28450, partial [Streptomyces pseudogriseolus]|uniref:hypothetical protein n=1 Tax=Streptomyces pseudogriseolus TaxID=36817 RepID=UPI003494E3A7